jgi:hypothetical protein
MPDSEQTTKLKKPQQSEKDAWANPHRPEYYVPRGVLKLARLLKGMGKQG